MRGHDTQDLIKKKKSVTILLKKACQNLNLVFSEEVSQCLLFACVMGLYGYLCCCLSQSLLCFVLLEALYVAIWQGDEFFLFPPFGGQMMTKACNRLKRRDSIWWMNRIFLGVFSEWSSGWFKQNWMEEIGSTKSCCFKKEGWKHVFWKWFGFFFPLWPLKAKAKRAQ